MVLTLGYPKRDDEARRLVLPYKGYVVKEIASAFWTRPGACIRAGCDT